MLAEERAKIHSRGEALTEVPVSLAEFTEYCRSVGQHPSFETPSAIAVKKAEKLRP